MFFSCLGIKDDILRMEWSNVVGSVQFDEGQFGNQINVVTEIKYYVGDDEYTLTVPNEIKGRLVTVYYDPIDPSISTIYPVNLKVNFLIIVISVVLMIVVAVWIFPLVKAIEGEDRIELLPPF